jgi:hypothetical protein
LNGEKPEVAGAAGQFRNARDGAFKESHHFTAQLHRLSADQPHLATQTCVSNARLASSDRAEGSPRSPIAESGRGVALAHAWVEFDCLYGLYG